MKIEYLYYADCPSHEEGLERLQAAMAAEGVRADVRVVEVKTGQEATDLEFIGSPTIRIDGEDVDPQGLEGQPYVLTCRVYMRSDGRPSPLPEAELIRRQLRAAMQ